MKMKNQMSLLILCLILPFLGCTSLPEGIEPVSNLDINRYMGKWYEIARLDHSFERGLQNVSATYSLNLDGSVKVLNRGFNPETQEWQEAEGRAWPVSDPKTGHLKVSFFGPFYASYVIFEMDQQDYQYAFITGYNRSYLWLLARRPEVDPKLKARFIQSAKKLGFETGELIFVKHDQP